MDNAYQAAFKILGGTLRGDEDLCRTCRFAHRMRRADTNREEVRCDANYSHPAILRGPVGECNRYNDARIPTLDMMQEIAWSLMTDRGGRKIGFHSPDQLRERGGSITSSPLKVGF